MLYTQYQKGQHKNLFSTYNNIKYIKNKQDSISFRAPSSIYSSSLKENETAHLLHFLRDYFSYSRFQTYLDYHSQITIQLPPSNQESKDLILKKKIKDIVYQVSQDVINPDALASDDPRLINHTVGLIAQNQFFPLLKARMLEFFEKDKINAQKVLINLEFRPVIDQQFSYQNEINQSASLKWHNDKNLHVQKPFQKIPDIRHYILAHNLPSTSNFYQYKAGVISLEINRNKDEKSYIRFRKYVNAPSLSKLSSFIKAKDFRLNLIHLQKLSEINERSYSTIDLIHQFDTANLLKPHQLKITFGKLESLEFINETQDYNDINSGQFNFHGVIKKDNTEYLFETHISQLNFDLQVGQFKTNSQLTTTILKKDISGQLRNKLKFEVRRNFLDTHLIDLVESLNLGELYQVFKGKGQQK